MSDYVRCLYYLPLEGSDEILYQTRSLMDEGERYEIRPDGTLWFEECDSSFFSDPSEPFGFVVEKDNHRWVKMDYTQSVLIIGERDGTEYEITFWFKNGVVADYVIHNPRVLEDEETRVESKTDMFLRDTASFLLAFVMIATATLIVHMVFSSVWEWLGY